MRVFAKLAMRVFAKLGMMGRADEAETGQQRL